MVPAFVNAASCRGSSEAEAIDMKAREDGSPGTFTGAQPQSGLGQRVALQVEILILGGDASGADEHIRTVMQLRFPYNRFSNTFSLQNEWRFEGSGRHGFGA